MKQTSKQQLARLFLSPSFQALSHQEQDKLFSQLCPSRLAVVRREAPLCLVDSLSLLHQQEQAQEARKQKRQLAQALSLYKALCPKL